MGIFNVHAECSWLQRVCVEGHRKEIVNNLAEETEWNRNSVFRKICQVYIKYDKCNKTCVCLFISFSFLNRDKIT